MWSTASSSLNSQTIDETSRSPCKVLVAATHCREEAQKSKMPSLRTLTEFAVKNVLLVPVSALTYKLPLIRELWLCLMARRWNTILLSSLGDTQFFLFAICTFAEMHHSKSRVPVACGRRTLPSCNSGMRPISPVWPLFCVSRGRSAWARAHERKLRLSLQSNST